MIFLSKDVRCIVRYVPSVHDRHDSSLPLCDLHEGRLRHVEVDSWLVAPATIIRILGPVWQIEARGGHRGKGDFLQLQAPLRPHALDLAAGPATVPRS